MISLLIFSVFFLSFFILKCSKCAIFNVFEVLEGVLSGRGCREFERLVEVVDAGWSW